MQRKKVNKTTQLDVRVLSRAWNKTVVKASRKAHKDPFYLAKESKTFHNFLKELGIK